MNNRLLILGSVTGVSALMAQAMQSAYPAAKVRTVATRAAYRRGLAWQPDLVLADIGSARFTCLEALQLVRSECPGVPFIIVTDSLDEVIVACLRAGADGYFLKANVLPLGRAVT